VTIRNKSQKPSFTARSRPRHAPRAYLFRSAILTNQATIQETQDSYPTHSDSSEWVPYKIQTIDYLSRARFTIATLQLEAERLSSYRRARELLRNDRKPGAERITCSIRREIKRSCMAWCEEDVMGFRCLEILFHVTMSWLDNHYTLQYVLCELDVCTGRYGSFVVPYESTVCATSHERSIVSRHLETRSWSNHVL
jgi:hypothetical protein